MHQDSETAYNIVSHAYCMIPCQCMMRVAVAEVWENIHVALGMWAAEVVGPRGTHKLPDMLLALVQEAAKKGRGGCHGSVVVVLVVHCR